MISREKFEADRKVDKKTSFRHFMNQPMTRAMISTLPPSENLEVLLEAAYEHGFDSGSASTAVHLITSIMKEPK